MEKSVIPTCFYMEGYQSCKSDFSENEAEAISLIIQVQGSLIAGTGTSNQVVEL